MYNSFCDHIVAKNFREINFMEKYLLDMYPTYRVCTRAITIFVFVEVLAEKHSHSSTHYLPGQPEIEKNFT